MIDAKSNVKDGIDKAADTSEAVAGKGVDKAKDAAKAASNALKDAGTKVKEASK